MVNTPMGSPVRAIIFRSVPQIERKLGRRFGRVPALPALRSVFRHPAWLDASAYLFILASVLLATVAPIPHDLGSFAGGLSGILDLEYWGRVDDAVVRAIATVELFPVQLEWSPPVTHAVRLLLAGWFTFGLARALGIGRFGAIVAGQTAALGGYFAAGVAPADLFDAGIWLPATLLFTHAALRSIGVRRLVAFTCAGAAFGLVVLGGTPTSVLAVLLVLWSFLVVRLIAGPVAPLHDGRPAGEALGHLLRGSRLAMPAGQRTGHLVVRQAGRILALLACAVLIPGIGFSLAAVRIAAGGAGGLSERIGDATAGGPPALLMAVQLVLPFFFRNPDGTWWSVTPALVFYVGLVPLCLAVLAPVLAPRWDTLFFSVTAAVSTAMMLGARSLPGQLAGVDSVASLPLQLADLALLSTLALALLAGFGADGLERRLAGSAEAAVRARRPAQAASTAWPAGLLVGLPIVSAFLLMVGLTYAARWAEVGWRAAFDLLRRLAIVGVGANFSDPLVLETLLAFQRAIDPSRTTTLWSIGVLIAFGLMALLRTQLPQLRVVACAAILLLIAFDLSGFMQSEQFLDRPRPVASAVTPSVGVNDSSVVPPATDRLVRMTRPIGDQPPVDERISASVVPEPLPEPLSTVATELGLVQLAGRTTVAGYSLTVAAGVTLLAFWLVVLARPLRRRLRRNLGPIWHWTGEGESNPTPESAVGLGPNPIPGGTPTVGHSRTAYDMGNHVGEVRGSPIRHRVRRILGSSIVRGAGRHTVNLGRGAWGLGRLAATGTRWVVARPFWIECACLLAILGIALLFVWYPLSRGEVIAEYDTRTYYYPVTADVQRALSEGRLPLWTTRIFGGFPLFAEGEPGALYPFKLIALRLVSPVEALGWIALGNFIVAGWGMYFFGRALGLSRFASVIGGIAFQGSSFIVAQAHHTSLHSSAVWLPWILAGAERAISSTGLRRLTGASIGGGALLLATLGLHPQPVLMSLMLVVAYVVWRFLTGPYGMHWPIRWPGPWQVPGSFWRSAYRLFRNLSHLFVREWVSAVMRLVLVGIVLAGVLGVGLGLASIQLLPLLELASRSIRQHGVEYAFASTYSMPVFHLVQLLLPYAFRTELGTSWTLWSAWEISLYGGVGTLILAIAAVVLARGRLVVFFAIAFVVSVLLAFGEYSPIRLHELLFKLPGFSALRVPGRFGLIALASLAVLAMLGADWFDRRFCSRPVRPFGGFSRALTIGFLGALAVVAALLPVFLWGLRSLAIEQAPRTINWIGNHYLNIRRDNQSIFSAAQIYEYVLRTLDPLNERTLLAVLLFATVTVLLIVWFAAPQLRHVWRIALLGVVAFDAVTFATAYHETRPFEAVTTPMPVESFLASRSGIDRVAVQPHLAVAAPNTLMPLGVNDFGGYSSLDPERVYAFADWMVRDGSALLNLGNIRFLAIPNKPLLLPSYEGVAVYPRRPLAEGRARNPNSRAVFRVRPSYTDNVRIVTGLFDAAELTDGTPVAEVVVSDDRGRRESVVLLAGRHTAEWAYDRPDVRALIKHSRPPSAFRETIIDPDGRTYVTDQFYAELPLTESMEVTRVEFRNIHPKAGIRLHGVALWNVNDSVSESMTWEQKEQFRLVWSSERTVVYENLQAFPKARLVRAAVPSPPDRWGLYTMALEDYDPSSMTFLDASAEFWESYRRSTLANALAPGGFVSAPDRVWVTDYTDERVVVRVDSNAPGFLILHDTYLPGWRARIGGVEVPVQRADYMYRAIEVPPGTYDVVWTYEPESVAVGGLMTLIAAAGTFAFWIYALVLRPGVIWTWRGIGLGARGLYSGRRRSAPAVERFRRRWARRYELPALDVLGALESETGSGLRVAILPYQRDSRRPRLPGVRLFSAFPAKGRSLAVAFRQRSRSSLLALGGWLGQYPHLLRSRFRRYPNVRPERIGPTPNVTDVECDGRAGAPGPLPRVDPT